MTENFDDYWKQYKKVPMYCEPMLDWLGDLADNALVGGMSLNESQKVRLFTAIKNTADTCKDSRKKVSEPNLEVILRELEKDISTTFDVLDEASMNLGDKIGSFRFYLSGLKNGYTATLKNIGRILKSPLIDGIFKEYENYDEGIITNDRLWKDIAELLTINIESY